MVGETIQRAVNIRPMEKPSAGSDETSRKSPAQSRRGGRAAKHANDGSSIVQPPVRQLKIPFTPTPIVSADELESIHLASMRVLREIGLDVLHDEARAIMKRAGADVREGRERVRFDSDLIAEQISHAPSEFMMHARNPLHNYTLGGNNLVFLPVASAPNCSDLDRGRRPGSQADFRDFVKLTQIHNILSGNGGYPVEPVDIHASVRHLECLRDIALLTDKSFHVYSLGRDRNLDGIEIARIANGLTRDQLNETPVELVHGLRFGIDLHADATGGLIDQVDGLVG